MEGPSLYLAADQLKPFKGKTVLSVSGNTKIEKETKKFSLLFYKWRKVFLLRKHLDIYQKSICPRCGAKLKREKTGKRNRMSHFCPVCQSRMAK